MALAACEPGGGGRSANICVAYTSTAKLDGLRAVDAAHRRKCSGKSRKIENDDRLECNFLQPKQPMIHSRCDMLTTYEFTVCRLHTECLNTCTEMTYDGSALRA